MCEVVKVLERELENSGLIYVYQEGYCYMNIPLLNDMNPFVID